MEWHLSKITNKHILLAALDWGMGHTTRCVVIIRQLMKQNNTVIFAGTPSQREFIQREFPGIKTIHLEGYQVTLDSTQSTYWQMLNQFRKIRRSIKNEYRVLQELIGELKIDLIISDNRYGFFNEKTPSVLITHQLNLQLPFLQKMVNRRLNQWIEKFTCVWIPDGADQKLTGQLTRITPGIPKIFIGPLSRFRKVELPKKYDYLGVVSGPEPARTAFALKLEKYLAQQGKKSALVGFEGSTAHIDYYKNPTSGELEKLLAASEIIISRAGYTTIMELAALEKKAILIPTPGQFEQEYLAQTVHIDNICFLKEATFTEANSKKTDKNHF